jgi:glycosyltransferase involved in cell wall biosynthesis
VLACAINRILANPDQARQMGLRGQSHVREKFEMATVVRQHEDVYEACCAGS